ncbi:PKD domain-containing protein [Streptomyces mutabilis]|uniref:PKD domain-containing protein n=1 Tax=Streptomyces mutabilis TaxID=67332 RepID=UPI0036CAB30D
MRTGRKRLGVCVGVAVTTVLGVMGAGTAQAAGPAKTAESTILGAGQSGALSGKYVVALEGRASLATSKAAVRSQAAELTEQFGGTVHRVYSTAFRGFALSATEAEAKRIAADPAVRYVQADKIVRASGIQPDPPSWGLDAIDGVQDSSYTYPVTGSGVSAYVVDTGVDLDHPNFEGRAGSGYDFVDDDTDASDCQGHGTHVAGTIGSKDYGVAKQVDIVSVRVLDCEGSGTISGVVAGMDWVARNATRPAVANMSLGGGGDRALDDSVQGAIDAGVPVAVAAGNAFEDACLSSPARLPDAITLGSTDRDGSRSSFSNLGRCVDLFAPGGSILSTANGGGQTTLSGTSMAAPHAAGAAALYLSAHPDATSKEVHDALVTNARSGVVGDPGSGSPNLFLDVSKLGGPAEPGTPVAEFAAQCSTANTTCTFDASAATDPDGRIASYAWNFGDGTTGEGVTTSHTYAKAGTYQVKLTVTDDSGTTATTTREATAGSEPSTGEPPSAFASADCMDETCTFNADGTSDPDGDIASYAWDFGDGTAGTGETVTHDYPNVKGDYTIRLTVTDRAGHTDIATSRVQCIPIGARALCFAQR